MTGTTDDIERLTEEADLRSSFPRGGSGLFLADAAVAEYRVAGTDAEREAARDRARLAATYAGHAWRLGAYDRHASLDDWHAIPARGYGDAVSRGEAVRASWAATDPAPGPDDDEAWAAYDAAEAAREAEAERVDRLEDEGAYGRTLAHTPDADTWIFVRFGHLPAGGRSAFGLAGEDTEDGPDPWRAEMGNMTHEAGMSVFRAYRHPDIEGDYVLIEPCFDHALYGVPGWESYLLSVIPRYRHGEERSAALVSGKPLASMARDRTMRLELGSDGEFLVDPRSPVSAEPLSLDKVHASPGMTVARLLERRVAHEWETYPMDGDDEPSSPGVP